MFYKNHGRQGLCKAETFELARCKAYHDAIMADLHTSASPEILGVMKNVPNPYTSKHQNIIVRNDDDVFWSNCILELDGGITRRRMAVIGTPGIGKSTSISHLIRLLLTQNKTVVYLLRSEEQLRHYIEFSPKNDNGTVEMQITLFPESESPKAITSLRKEATYFIVDPGQTKINCNPIAEVSARVIIVASPDDRHWGKSSFTKKTEVGDGGVFRYFRPWTLAQLTWRFKRGTQHKICSGSGRTALWYIWWNTKTSL